MCYLLILDDDPLWCETLKDALTRSQVSTHFEVETTEQISGALEKARRAVEVDRPFDVFLIDQHLGQRLDGIEVMGVLHEISPESDAIIFTGAGDLESGQRAYSVGAFRYLQKPFQVQELLFQLQSLIEWRRVQRERNRLKVLNEIGRQVAERAVLDDLTILLEEVRNQVGRLIDVSNFIIVLADRLTNQLDFRLHYEKNERQERHFLPLQEGMSGHLISLGEVLYLPAGDEAYLEKQSIDPHGSPAECWLGVPLRVENRVIGGIVAQNYERAYAFRKPDVDLLLAVADQISGTIQASINAEIERKEAGMLATMPKISAKMMELANHSEKDMWYTLLTFATADFGFRFNRAWLFLIDPSGTRLAGTMGVGNVDPRRAHLDWEQDARNGMTADKFLERLHAGKIEHTPLMDLVQEVFVDLNGGQNCISRVFKSGQRMLLSRAEAAERLPEDFVRLFEPTECAVLPVRAAEDVIGVMLVDNKHDCKPIYGMALDRLETFLNMAGLIWDNLRHRNSHEAMLGATSAIMGEAGDRPLNETLTRICDAARRIMAADWAIVYPLKPGAGMYEGGSFEYDVPGAGYSGLGYKPTEKDKPRPKGTSAHILRSGRLVVQDLSQDHTIIGEARLADHPYLCRVGIQAFIGMPIRDRLSREELGVMYLDYQAPRKFSEQDVQRAESFANLAAIAIRNSRQSDIFKAEMAEARRRGQASQRELSIYQGILSAVMLSPSEEVLVQAVTNATYELLNLAQLDVLLLLQEWRTEESGKTHSILCHLPVGGEKLPIEDGACGFKQSVADAVLWKTDSFLSRAGLQAYIPVRLGDRSLGMLYIRSQKERIGEDQKSALERLSAITAQSLDNIYRQKHLRGVLEAARAMMQPIGLEETLNAIVRSVHDTLPEISALTLWYWDPEEACIKYGPSFGVIHKKQMKVARSIEGTVVGDIMYSHEPVYAESIQEEPRLLRSFTKNEHIKSTAAFPLVADEHHLGAMFFNYRNRHRFSYEERLLFPLLAEIVAASISDAIALQSEKRQQKRLNAALAVARAIGASLDIHEIIQAVLRELQELFSDGDVMPCLFLYNEDEDALEFAPASREFYLIDRADADIKMLPLQGPSVACQVAARAKQRRSQYTLRVDNVLQDPDYLNLISTTRSELCTGLVGSGQLLGVLVLESSEEAFFGDDAEKLVEGVAQQVGLAIERARQSDEYNFANTVAVSTSWAAENIHDFNREVGKINNYAAWIWNENNDSQKVKEYARLIAESAGELEALNPWGDRPPECFLFDLEIQNIFNRLVGKVAGGRIEINFDLRCDGLWVKAHRRILVSVLRHLVRNASEAMRNERRLSVRTRPAENGMLRLVVVDSGPGFDEKVYPLLFKKNTTTKGERRGSGLMFVRQMVEKNMGGKIRALPPEPGCGAALELRLPSVSPEEALT